MERGIPSSKFLRLQRLRLDAALFWTRITMLGEGTKQVFGELKGGGSETGQTISAGSIFSDQECICARREVIGSCFSIATIMLNMGRAIIITMRVGSFVGWAARRAMPCRELYRAGHDHPLG